MKAFATNDPIKKLTKGQLEELVWDIFASLYLDEEGYYSDEKRWNADTLDDIAFYFQKAGITVRAVTKELPDRSKNKQRWVY